MTKEIYMIEELTKDIIKLLVSEKNISMQTALNIVYSSDTYQRLCNLSSGLYFQSTPYVYEFLTNELETGKTK